MPNKQTIIYWTGFVIVEREFYEVLDLRSGGGQLLRVKKEEQGNGSRTNGLNWLI